MNFDQLNALVAVVDQGTFEAAAHELGVTPSAVSQRIKALEKSVGQLAVVRDVPCRPTDVGEVLLRMGRQVDVLVNDTRDALGLGAASRSEIRVAVNADSLATWFVGVFADAADWADTTLMLHVEDQDHSGSLLRRGDALAAVTADPSAVSGCRVEKLGYMRYVPVAAPSVRDRFMTSAGVDWTQMPVLRFSDKDYLQRRVLDSEGVVRLPPVHTIPSSEGCLSAARAGLGWAMFPELQLGSEVDSGTLTVLDDDIHEDVALYWQTWALESERVERLSAAVRKAASSLLQPA